jgi:uncharacterized repeat protein (TIGR01451 family)
MPIRPPGTPTLDLTTDDSFGVIDGVVFETALAQPAGTGVFNTFDQIQHNGFEQGYNTDGTKQFDNKASAVFNHSILLSQIPTVVGDGTNGTSDGVVYREFLLDINEPNGGTKAFLSLDSLQIWQEEAGNLTGFTPGAGFAGSHTNNLVYNLDAGGDNWVGLNAGLSRGSGQSDIAVLVPDSLFVNDGTDRFVYLYSAFGAQSGWDAGGGFEEWGTTTPNGPNVPTNAMSISKTASVPGGTADQVGEVITYSVDVSDVGNTQLTNVAVTDPSVSDMTRGADIVGNNDNILDPGEIWSFTAHHTVTAADLAVGPEGGLIVNTATATSDQTGPVSATATVFVGAAPPHTIVTMTATVADGTADAPGDVINYAVSMFNDSTIDLTDPLVQEVVPNGNFLAGVESGGFNVGDTNQDGVLNPGETWQFVDSYTVTQADLDNRNGGGIPTVDPNLAHSLTVRGLYDQGGPDLGSATTPLVQNPHVAMTKTATLADGGSAADNAGDVIDYAIGLTNDGNMDLTNPMVSDPQVSDLAPVMSGGFNAGDTNQDGELSVGETWQYTADHTVTQAEMNNGGTIDNTASATTDQGASATASASVPVSQTAQAGLSETAAVQGGGPAATGDTLVYTFSLTNSGNVTLHDLMVSDTATSNVTLEHNGADIVGDANMNGLFDPGETWIYSGTHTLTDADITNGIVDMANASASGPQGQPASATASFTFHA